MSLTRTLFCSSFVPSLTLLRQPHKLRGVSSQSKCPFTAGKFSLSDTDEGKTGIGQTSANTIAKTIKTRHKMQRVILLNIGPISIIVEDKTTNMKCRLLKYAPLHFSANETIHRVCQFI
jgi:hypothetical protein